MAAVVRIGGGKGTPSSFTISVTLTIEEAPEPVAWITLAGDSVPQAMAAK